MAQPAPLNGPRPVEPGWHALVGAAVIPRPGEVIDNATIVIRDGIIVSVARGLAPPAGARIWDVSGLTIYPGLIDAHVPVEAPMPDQTLAGAHWNARVTPQRSALDGPGLSEKDRQSLRQLGFTVAAIAPKGGVFRGSGAVVLIAESGDNPTVESGDVLVANAFHEVALETSGFRSGEYPGSQMGAIALIRQTFIDAQWRRQALETHAKSGSPMPLPPADALDALLFDDAQTPILFDATDELQALRVAKIAREFDLDAMALGSGLEFRRLDAIVDDGLPIILPLNFPKAPKVESRAQAESVALRTLMTWEQAPTNPRRLIRAGARVALTTDRLKKRADFAKNLRSAIKHGLTEEQALAAMTVVPASMLGIDDRVGAIERGMIANLVVVDGSLFDEDATIRDVWVAGLRHEISEPDDDRLVGVWDATFGEENPMDAVMTIGDDDSLKIRIGEIEIKGRSVQIDGPRLSFLADGDDFGAPGVFSLTASLSGETLFGVYNDPQGGRAAWRATRAGDAGETDEDADAETEQSDDDVDDIPETLVTPLGAYGLASDHDETPGVVAITGATMWTVGPGGIIEDSALLIGDGKIIYAGSAAGAPDLAADLVIDATGKHLTPGLIDCHSHTGISGGVNEGTQAVTSEVRIFDVINPDAIGIYRQLAGGLTVINQLHGSANPIGGQNSVLKLRWGVEHPDDMRFEGAIPGIKFALGENVKQSNWGDNMTTRYPQTRMGVETIIRDRFIAAGEYAKAMTAHRPGQSKGVPPRRDLELEALAEILAGERLVHCHSYRQDEILMLCRVANDFGFTIGTFQHVLEGYKVAEAIRESAIGASAFSDWWAYKFEVIDAIPFNGAIMHDAGVPVSFNSDSNELARRMNTEAGKAVKYGGLTPEEAIRFVTLNPAMQLKIDHRVGSLEAGKDADFVIWSGDPLSTLSRCESTWIDGVERFSLEIDADLRRDAQRERSRLMQKLLASKSESRNGKNNSAGDDDDDEMIDAPAPTEAELAYEAWAFEIIRAGGSLDDHLCGSCGDNINIHAHN